MPGRFDHYADTHRYIPEHYEHSQELHGLPVHDEYGERAIDHNPFHQDFVHGTNYELLRHHPDPVMEHNPHAFPATTASK